MSKYTHDWETATLVLTLPSRSVIAHHVHDEHQLVYASAGVIAVTTAAGSWIAPSNRGIWIPAGATHQHRAYGPTKLHGVGLPADCNPLGLSNPAVVAVDPLLRELIIRYTAPATAEDDPARRARILEVLLDEVSLSPQQPIRLPTAVDPRLVEACRHVEAQLGAPIDLEHLARLCGSSSRTLARLFREEMAMSYVQWRTQLRLHHAVRMLADDIPVGTVAHRCGWKSASSFVVVFRRTFGHTPGGRQPRQ
ncbi:helix-turn-helix transcriptional regulator [Streptomyces sp. AK02-01A]|uniref:AraC family transcriptional regulator n=1 Tax=Streptomyces sp. AK02-01A TaxID=3028648 RepID=UPI0029A95930|nr:helix-turn-helix transcriptional regulator [Streptomyces sp. AK02-01A]MDX3853143.1 helix-turn-helix transcriptional regulator [Streptomyces sp. AK02-01A]